LGSGDQMDFRGKKSRTAVHSQFVQGLGEDLRGHADDGKEDMLGGFMGLLRGRTGGLARFQLGGWNEGQTWGLPLHLNTLFIG
jgi:hypothetical protein